MWKFCPLCAASLEGQSNEMYGTCTSCGQHWYKNPKPTVGAYIVKSSNILLVRRAVEPRKGYWDIPGGFVRDDENPEEAVKRELREELSLEVINLKLIGVIGPEEYQYQKITQKNFEISYLCGINESTPPSPSDDIDSVSWFPLDDLPEMAFKINTLGVANLNNHILDH